MKFYSLILYWAFFSMLGSLSTHAQDALNIGDKAPDFALKNVEGTIVSLSDYESEKGLVVVFTCNHCPYAVLYEDRIIDLHNKYAAKGFPVVAINPNDPEVQPQDSFEKMRERAEEKNFPFHYLLDENQKIYPQYGATRTPHFFLLDQERKVRYIGALDDNPKDAALVEDTFLENAMQAVIDGKTPNPSLTKAIGCTIKTKQ